MKVYHHIFFHILLFFSCLFISFDVQGQKIELDSLQQKLSYLHGNEKIETLLKLAEKKIFTSLDEATLFAEEALQLSLASNEEANLAKAYEVLAKTDYFRGDLQKAINNFKQGLRYAKLGDDSMKVAFLQNNLGVMYKKQGEYEHALYFFYRARGNFEEIQKIKTLSKTLMNIGSVHFYLKQYQKAINIYHKVIPILEGNNDVRNLSFAYNNLGDVYFEQEKYEVALEFYKKSLGVKYKNNLSTFTINTLKNVGTLFYTIRNYDSAEAYYDKAIVLAKAQDRKLLLLKSYEGKGDVAYKKKEWNKALTYYETSLDMAQGGSVSLSIAKLHENISKLYARIGDHKKAYEYQVQYNVIRDSLQIKDSQKQMNELEKQFASQADFKLQISDLEKKEEIGKWKMYTMCMILAFFLMGLGGLYYQIYQRKKANSLLRSKNIAIRDKNILLQRRAREISQQNVTLTSQSREIKMQNQLLLQSNTDLEQFAYVASHDLREPLRTIRSYMQLLEKRYAPKLDDNAKEFIEFAVNGSERMDNLLKDLLNYSRIGREVISKKELDLTSIMEQVIYNLSGQIEDNKAEVFIEPLPIVYAYEVQMRQLLQNLLSNAIKFRGEAPPRIYIRVRKYAQRYVISVQDNGIGIEAKYQEKVFTIFQRLHTQAKYKGTGIGLAICKRISQNHGGDLWFESEPDKGTTFFVSLSATDKVILSQ